MTSAFHDTLPLLLKSEIYDCLNTMPKPAVHHIHPSACCNVKWIIREFTYYDFVYFSDRNQKFLIAKNAEEVTDRSYVRVTELRKYWRNSLDFDEYLANKILLHRGTLQS